MKTEKYTNRYGDEYTFTLQNDGNIKWEGPFEYCRFGFTDDPNIRTMVDPSGGCYLEVGMSMDILGFENAIITGFESIEGGYLILTKPINKKEDVSES